MEGLHGNIEEQIQGLREGITNTTTTSVEIISGFLVPISSHIMRRSKILNECSLF